MPADAKVRTVERVQALLPPDLVEAFADAALEARIRAEMKALVTPEFRVEMVASPSAGGARVEYIGLDGWRDAWADWTEPYESFGVELGEVIEGPDGVLSLVEIGGVTKTGGVAITTPAAAVWTVEDGLVVAVEFHLDQDTARRAAGL